MFEWLSTLRPVANAPTRPYSDDLDDAYAKDVASWEIEHDTYRQDYTAEQWQRQQLVNRALDAGIWSLGLPFVLHLRRAGVITENGRSDR